MQTTFRIEAISDGVIAIITTLMVFDLLKPAHIAFKHTRFLPAFRDIIEPFLVFLLSFVVVMIILVNHHGLMRRASRATSALYWANAHLLFWVSLIPVSTAILGDNLFKPIAVAFYGLVLTGHALAMTITHFVVLKMGRKGKKLISHAGLWRDSFFTGFYACTVPCAFFSVYISLAVFIVIPIVYFLPKY